jgi:hypothetical protein
MKAVLTILFLLFSLTSFAQNAAFVGLSFSNIGQSLQAGAIYKNNVVKIGYSAPLTSAVNPTLFFAMLGHQINLGNQFAVTASAGYSLNKSKAPIGTIEVSKDYFNGRFFIAANYCKVFFAGAGIKVFIK